MRYYLVMWVGVLFKVCVNEDSIAFLRLYFDGSLGLGEVREKVKRAKSGDVWPGFGDCGGVLVIVWRGCALIRV